MLKENKKQGNILRGQCRNWFISSKYCYSLFILYIIIPLMFNFTSFGRTKQTDKSKAKSSAGGGFDV